MNNSLSNPIFQVFPSLKSADLSELKSIAQSSLIAGTSLYRQVVENLNQTEIDSTQNTLELYTIALKSYLESLLYVPLEHLNHTLINDNHYFPNIVWSTSYRDYHILVVTGVDLISESYAIELDRFINSENMKGIMRLHSLYVINTSQLPTEISSKVEEYLQNIEEKRALQHVIVEEFNELYPSISNYLAKLSEDVSLYQKYFNEYFQTHKPQPTLFSQIPVYAVDDTHPSLTAILSDSTPLGCKVYNPKSRNLKIVNKFVDEDGYRGIAAYFKFYSQYVHEDELIALATYWVSRMNFTITEAYLGKDKVPFYKRTMLTLTPQLIEYIILGEGYIIEPQIASYCNDIQLLVEAIQSKLRDPEVKEILRSLRTGDYGYSEWYFPSYLGLHNYISEVDDNKCEYNYIAAELLSSLFNLEVINYGSRRVVFSVGDYVIKLWVRTNTQHKVEVQFSKEKPDFYTEVAYADEDFILTNKAITLLDFKEDRIYNVDILGLYHKLKDVLPNYSEDVSQEDAVSSLVEYYDKQMTELKSYLFSSGYNTSDLYSSNLGVECSTGKLKVLDAGYTYKLSNPPRLYNIDSTPHFCLESKNNKLGTSFYSIETSLKGSDIYIARDFQGNEKMTERGCTIHKHLEVSDACMAVALKELEDDYKASRNLPLITPPYPIIPFSSIMDKAKLIPRNCSKIPVIFIKYINGKLTYVCKEYNFKKDDFKTLFRIYTLWDKTVQPPTGADRVSMQTRLSISYGCNTLDIMRMSYDLEEHLLHLGIECVSEGVFYLVTYEDEEDSIQGFGEGGNK